MGPAHDAAIESLSASTSSDARRAVQAWRSGTSSLWTTAKLVYSHAGFQREAEAAMPKSMRQFIRQAVKAGSRKKLKNVTPETETMNTKRGYVRARMRTLALREGRPAPTEADYEAAGVGITPKEIAQARVLVAMKARDEQIKAMRICATCHIDLARICAPRPEEDPAWRCALSRCVGPLTKWEARKNLGGLRARNGSTSYYDHSGRPHSARPPVCRQPKMSRRGT
jgi:hypothetical protein